MKNLTIRAKITLVFIIFMTVILGLSYTVFLAADRTVMRTITEDDLLDTVNIDLEQIDYHPRKSPPEPRQGVEYREYKGGYFAVSEDFMKLIYGVGVGVYDADHQLIYGEDLIPMENEQIPFREGKLQTVHSGPDVFYVFDRQLKAKGVGEIWLRGSVDRDQRQEEVSEILRGSLFLLPALLLLAAIGTYFLTKRSLAPIDRMVETAGSISGGSDLKRRITTEGGERNEIQRLATSFNEMMQRLDRSFEAEKQFTSDVSHELRTPMSVILAQCELALEEEELSPEEAREALELILRQGNRMNDMIEDMLTYTRIDRHHERYPMKPLDLSDLVRESCGEFRPAIKRASVLSEEVSDGITVSGSDPLLRRMLRNLLENADRYGSEGGQIRVSLYRDEEHRALLKVADDGIGIGPEHLDRIFDRFYQADPSRTGEGSGLGLAMVKEIAQMHDGSIDVVSRPGEGSEFTVTFPTCQ